MSLEEGAVADVLRPPDVGLLESGVSPESSLESRSTRSPCRRGRLRCGKGVSSGVVTMLTAETHHRPHQRSPAARTPPARMYASPVAHTPFISLFSHARPPRARTHAIISHGKEDNLSRPEWIEQLERHGGNHGAPKRANHGARREKVRHFLEGEEGAAHLRHAKVSACREWSRHSVWKTYGCSKGDCHAGGAVGGRENQQLGDDGHAER